MKITLNLLHLCAKIKQDIEVHEARKKLFLIRYKSIRGQHKVMVTAYISVFVCFTTKAIHQELVSDLTSACFLASLERFISRRSTPLQIYSDNSKTFVGAGTSIRNIKTFF